MNFHLWSFLFGISSWILLEQLLSIPLMRRHRQVMYLLDRAKMYQVKASKFLLEGDFAQAEKARTEVYRLLEQAENLRTKKK